MKRCTMPKNSSFPSASKDEENSSSTVDRREAIKVLAAGTSTFFPLSQLAHSRVVTPVPVDGWVPHFFTKQQDKIVTAIAELILPETDTPGAKTAQVNRHIDLVLSDETEKVQRGFLEGLAWLEERSRDLFDAGFLEATEAQQTELLTEISKPSKDGHNLEHLFFLDIKERTVFAYYTSQIGIHQELEYKGKTPVPKWNGCTHPEHQNLTPQKNTQEVESE